MTNLEVAEFLAGTQVFRGLAPETLLRLSADLTETSLKDGDILVRQGQLNTSLHLLRKGKLRVTSLTADNSSRVLFDVLPGESVAEIAMIAAEPSLVTIDAVGAAEVTSLSRAAFDRLADSDPRAALVLMQSMREPMQRYRLSVALHLSSLFDSLPPDVLRSLETELEMVTLLGGEVLFRQGDPGDYLCLVVSGRVSVLSERGADQRKKVAELGLGELVGEMAVVSPQPRTATIEAIRDTLLAKLTKAGYERFFAKHPGVAARMVQHKLVERLKETTAGRFWQPRDVATIAVLPVHASSPHGAFCERLTAAFAKYGTAAHLKSEEVDKRLGREGIAQAYVGSGFETCVTEWLNRQELEHSYLVLESDSTLSPWTERCVRQADLILLVADASSSPEMDEMEKDLLGFLPHRGAIRISLVLIQQNGDPKGTTRWLDARQVERHFHVRAGPDPGGEDESVERLARTITGRAVGLTLGGGFARGLAHIGVFRAMEEIGVAVDAVGGSSMGSIVGALWAMGFERRQIQKKILDLCTEMFGDLTFPFIAFKTGRKFSSSVRELIGDRRIEDLWMPYFCVSANLNRSELKVHTRGSLAKAVLAASRAPGVFPPIVYDGELHVDGGVINNVPVDLMKEFSNSGITFGVDVSPPHELNETADYGDTVSGWRAFWKRLKPFAGRVYTPSILLVMIRTLEYSGIANKNVRLKSADLYMYPEMLQFKRTDFHRAEEIEQAGYACAIRTVGGWKESAEAKSRRPDLQGTLQARA
jgi:predicted acylesterase/phospholipase RssA/CRP-like cAMP-binding protein